jgi:aspartate aminotransferase
MIACATVRLSRRVQRIGESATLRAARRAAELRARGVEVVDLSAGEPDFPSPPVAVEAARRALADGFTKYTPNPGIPGLRKAISERYRGEFGAPWSVAETLVTVGGKGALFESALALYEEGDEVVLHTPAWVTFAEQIRFCGAQVVEVPTRGDDGFAIHADALLGALTGRTRAVVLNSPCNPTGGTIGATDLRKLVEGCARRGVLLLADETYERFVYDGAPTLSVASLAAEFPDTVVIAGSFSKTYAMTGWRLGYLIGPRELVDAAGRIQSHATSNATSFAMVGALAAMESAEADVRAMVAEFEARRDLLVPRLNALPGVSCRTPGGAFYVFPDVSSHFGPELPGSVEFAERLLEEEAVAVVAGEAFGSDRHVRISFACARETLEQGLERLERFLKKH